MTSHTAPHKAPHGVPAANRADPAATATVYPHITRSLAGCPIVDKGGYDYFVHPLADGIPRVVPALLDEAAEGIAAHLADVIDDVDVLVTAEAMGLPLVAAAAAKVQRPYLTVRKRAYGLTGERHLDQRTGYGRAALYLNDVHPGDRVAIVDDVVSTGGTLRALVAGLREAGASVAAVVSVFSKDPDLDALAGELGCPVRALVTCRVDRDRSGHKHVVLVATDVVSKQRS